jgi:hypothetical protein
MFFQTFAAHFRACNGFHVLLHILIHQPFQFSMLEAVFSLSALITENTADVQIFVVYPHSIPQIDSHGDCNNQGYSL